MRIILDNYIKLISDFINNFVTVIDFEKKHLIIFNEEIGEITEKQ